MPAYPLREVCGNNIHRRSWNTSRSTAFSDSSADSTLRRGQARSKMQLLHLGLGRHLRRFPVGLVSMSCLTSLLLGILDTWPGRANVVVFSHLGEVVRHSGLCEFHSCALCREMSNQGRNLGGTIPGRQITGAPKSRNNVASFFFNAVHLLSTYLRFKYEGAKLVFLSRVQSNLGTLLCHTVDSSPKSDLWCLHLILSVIAQDSRL